MLFPLHCEILSIYLFIVVIPHAILSNNYVTFLSRCTYAYQEKYGNFTVSCRGTSANFIWHLHYPLSNFIIYGNVSTRSPNQPDFTPLMHSRTEYCDLVSGGTSHPIISILFNKIIRSLTCKRIIETCPCQPVSTRCVVCFRAICNIWRIHPHRIIITSKVLNWPIRCC